MVSNPARSIEAQVAAAIAHYHVAQAHYEDMVQHADSSGAPGFGAALRATGAAVTAARRAAQAVRFAASLGAQLRSDGLDTLDRIIEEGTQAAQFAAIAAREAANLILVIADGDPYGAPGPQTLESSLRIAADIEEELPTSLEPPPPLIGVES